MKCVGRTLAVLAALGTLGAALVVGFGLYDVSAREGHLPGVSWILHTTYRNAVRRKAPPAEQLPPLEDPALVALGAGHYDSACRVCHGAPGIRRSQTVKSLVPQPPPIRQAAGAWGAPQLFWIVANGVKMSGMPHWPSRSRQDDVWPVVAFLLQVPDMSAREYAQLVSSTAKAGAHSAPPSGRPGLNGRRRISAESSGSSPIPPGRAADAHPARPQETTTSIEGCVICHARDGRSFGNTHIPRLDLLNTDYLVETLLAYRRGDRYSGIMQHAASRLDDRALEAAARHYATQGATGLLPGPTPETPKAPEPELVEYGATIARGEENAREVPACIACHGPWPEPIADDFPRISGQHEAYLLTQLRLWKAGQRGGTELSRFMHQVVPALSDDQLRAAAAYYASDPVGGATGR